jgi:hypothetical protein
MVWILMPAIYRRPFFATRDGHAELLAALEGHSSKNKNRKMKLHVSGKIWPPGDI